MSEKKKLNIEDLANTITANPQGPLLHLVGYNKKLTPSINLYLCSAKGVAVSFTADNTNELLSRTREVDGMTEHTLYAVGNGNVMALQEALQYAADALLKLPECSEGLK